LHHFVVPYPANAAIFQPFMIQFIEFKLMHPMELIKKFDPDFKMNEEFGKDGE